MNHIRFGQIRIYFSELRSFAEVRQAIVRDWITGCTFRLYTSCLSVCLPVCLSMNRSVCSSVCLFVCLSMNLSICLFVVYIFCIYLRSNINYRLRADLNNERFEILSIDIFKPNNVPFNITVLYRPASCNVGFFSTLEKIVQTLNVESKEFILLGDLNCNYITENYDNQLNHIKQISETFQPTELIKEPTRITPSSKTLIDVIFFKRSFTNHTHRSCSHWNKWPQFGIFDSKNCNFNKKIHISM